MNHQSVQDRPPSLHHLTMRAALSLLLLALVAGVLSGKLFKKRRPVIIQRQPTVARTQGSGIGNKTKFNKKTGFFAFLKNKLSNIKRKFGKREAENVDHPAKIRNKRELFLEGDCEYACQPDGSCAVSSGGARASCFSAVFGGGCIGSVPGCKDCNQVRFSFSYNQTHTN